MKQKPLLISHPDCARHQLQHHPECPARLKAVLDRLMQTGLNADMQTIDALEISPQALALTHPKKYIEKIEHAETTITKQTIKLDDDTYMSRGSTRAAKLAAGAVIEATTRILKGQTQRAFCAVRPPGHHAEIAESFGFCLFNNIATGVKLALCQEKIQRIAILDFDVHHCNGTVDIFKDDPRVLVCSSFQEDFYPHRYLDFTNEHIINTPLAAGTKGTEFRREIEAQWLPQLARHKPDLIYISAGFDAHEQDHLAALALKDEDYAWITELIVGVANTYSKGRIISVLEGGYNLDSLASAAAAHVTALIS